MTEARPDVHFDPVRAPSLRERVRHALYEALRTQRLRPGDRIVELRLAREMGVSQTVIREALRELEQMGLVENFPNRGTYVRRITQDDAREIYSMRAALERFAVRLALPRLAPRDLNALESQIQRMVQAAQARDEQRFADEDVAFHRTIVSASGHKLLLRTWEGINPLNWTFVTYLRMGEDDPVYLAHRHHAVLQALRAGDVLQAQCVVEQHILELAEQIVPRIGEIQTESDKGGTILA